MVKNQLHVVQSSVRILREILRLDLHKMNGNIMETIKRHTRFLNLLRSLRFAAH